MRGALWIAVAALHLASAARGQEPPEGPAAPTVELRPVDRATVRVLTVNGVVPVPLRGRQTRIRRLLAAPRTGHGTGLVIDRGGLVLTARHVVGGADLVAVLLPGTDEVRAARVVYSDPDHDLAFLRVEGAPLPSALALPARPTETLRVGQRLSSSGYPLEVREPFPAATFGQLSRVRRDGTLQLDMSVNPGNSGGPVIDERGRLLGVLVARGDLRRGVEGLALAVPIERVLAAHARVPSGEIDFGEGARSVARVLADFARTDDSLPVYEQTTVETLDAAARTPGSPEARAIVAAHAWNMLMALLEDREVRGWAELPEADRGTATHLREVAEHLVREALTISPYLRVRYPALRGIAVGVERPYLPSE